MSKKNRKYELKLIKKIVEEESIEAFISYNVEFDFHGYDGEVQTVYVKEHLSSPNPVEYHMLDNMALRVKEINPRYRVGIIHEERVPEEEDCE
jgi:hypothetical protein